MANIVLRRASYPSNNTTNSYTRIFNCATTLTVGDVVYQSSTVDNFVVTSTNNNTFEPSIGVVTAKPSTTNCVVQFFGECSIPFVGIQRSKKVFLNTDGTLTTNVPTSGYLQQMGFSYEDNKVFIDPQEIRVKLNS